VTTSVPERIKSVPKLWRIAKVWIDPGGAWKTYAFGHRSR
jgi:hypothetical protein